MAGLQQGGDDEVISSINITPFVDIVLVLLIIFMVTSTYIARASIQVDLPEAASGGESVAKTVNIVITKQGELFLNGESTSEENLAAVIRRANEEEKEDGVQAVIAADKGVAYGEVVEIIDLVKKNGVKSFALNIDRKAE